MNAPLQLGEVFDVVWHRTAGSLDNTGYAAKERRGEISAGRECMDKR